LNFGKVGAQDCMIGFALLKVDPRATYLMLRHGKLSAFPLNFLAANRWQSAIADLI
jgi:hypothetical protein